MLHRIVALAFYLSGLFLLALFGCQPTPALTPTTAPSKIVLSPSPTQAATPSSTAFATNTLAPSLTPAIATSTRPPTSAPATATISPTAASRATAAVKTQLIGWIGGNVGSAVAANGSYAYVAVGPRLVVVNLTKPAQPLPVGHSPILPETIDNVAVANNYAYIADGSSGLYILNVAVPQHPTLSGLPISIDARRITLGSGYLYAATPEGLRIYALSDPSRPAQVSLLAIDGGFWNVLVAGKYAYAIAGNRTHIIDISDPTRPAMVGLYDLGTNPGDIAVAGSYAWIGTSILPKNSPNRATVHVVDIANPSKPARVVEIPMNGPVSSLLVRDNMAFVAAVTQLHIFDISNPRQPREVANYSSTAEITDLSLVGDQILLSSSTGDSLSILSIAHPEHPTLLGAYSPPKSVAEVAVSGHYAFVADGLRGLVALDVSDPTAPVPVGTSKPFFARDIALQGGYAYLVAIDGFHVVNVSDPLHPAEVGGVTLHDSGERVAVAGNRAYIAAGREFAIADITHPDAPSILSSVIRADMSALDIALTGHYALVAYGYGLRVFDVADSAHPKELAFLQSRNWAFRVTASGAYAYVADGSAGLRIISIADPSKPVEMGLAPAHYALGVTVSGNLAYLSDTISGLHIVDISDPRRPVEIELLRGQVSPRRVIVAGTYLYVTGTQGALLVLRRGA